MDTIIIQTKGDKASRRVAKSDYIAAKTKQLREFGYGNLTESDVAEQLDILLHKSDDPDLSVIGMMMKGEVRCEG